MNERRRSVKTAKVLIEADANSDYCLLLYGLQ